MVPVGIIAGGTVGSSILLLLFLLALALFLYRQRKGSQCLPSLPVSLYASLSLSLSISLSLSVCLSLYLALSVSVSFSLCLSVCLYCFVSLSVSLSTYLCFSFSLPMTVPYVGHIFRVCLMHSGLLPGRRGVTLGKPDIKVETVNKETHSLEEDSASVSTATRMVKAMYSVSFLQGLSVTTDLLSACVRVCEGTHSLLYTHTQTTQVTKHNLSESTGARALIEKASLKWNLCLVKGFTLTLVVVKHTNSHGLIA